MARRAAFLYSIDTDEAYEVLLKKMVTFAKAHKIDTTRDRPWYGFMTQNDGELRASTVGNMFYAYYGQEHVRKFTFFDGVERQVYFPYEIPIIADAKRKILAIGTSNKYLTEQVFTSIQREIEDSNYIRLKEITFPDEFLRWLVDNATTKGTKKFVRMSGVKLAKLVNYDSNLSDAILTGDDAIGKSKVYGQIKNKGVHKYLIGFAKIDKVDYKVRIYDFGQITVTVGGTRPVAPIFSVIAQELQSLRSVYDSS